MTRNSSRALHSRLLDRCRPGPWPGRALPQTSSVIGCSDGADDQARPGVPTGRPGLTGFRHHSDTPPLPGPEPDRACRMNRHESRIAGPFLQTRPAGRRAGHTKPVRMERTTGHRPCRRLPAPDHPLTRAARAAVPQKRLTASTCPGARGAGMHRAGARACTGPGLGGQRHRGQTAGDVQDQYLNRAEGAPSAAPRRSDPRSARHGPVREAPGPLGLSPPAPRGTFALMCASIAGGGRRDLETESCPGAAGDRTHATDGTVPSMNRPRQVDRQPPSKRDRVSDHRSVHVRGPRVLPVRMEQFDLLGQHTRHGELR